MLAVFIFECVCLAEKIGLSRYVFDFSVDYRSFDIHTVNIYKHLMKPYDMTVLINITTQCPHPFPFCRGDLKKFSMLAKKGGLALLEVLGEE